MDTLVALGVTAAALGGYFESGIVILAFILLGKHLEARAKHKTGEAIQALLTLAPKTAIVLRNKKEITISVDAVIPGDIVVVKPGQKIPVDGVVVLGHSTVDESMLTGESIPVEKSNKAKVFAGTLNTVGTIQFKATGVGADTFLSQIIQLVEEAQGSKAPIQEYADRVAAVFVPVVVIIAILTLFAWVGFGGGWTLAYRSFIAVLVIACPCALGLATPTAIIMGTGLAAKRGIIIKSAVALQQAQEAKTIVFDKTGTLTQGRPQVTDIVAYGVKESLVLALAAAIEKNSEHPLASAILARVGTQKLSAVKNFKAIIGQGLSGSVAGKNIVVGNQKLMQAEKIKITAATDDIKNLTGKTLLFVAQAKKLIGIIAVQDTVTPEAKAAVSQLQRMGKTVVMLTGDQEAAARAIATDLGITQVIAGVLPAGKARAIRDLQKKGSVIMVGDGINDAPALAQANVSIAMGHGTDTAIAAGEIIIMRHDVRAVATAIHISRYTLRKIKQNLFWAFAYNIVLIPVAAGVLYPFNGFTLNPMLAGMAMSLSSISVVSNALLMKFYKSR